VGGTVPQVRRIYCKWNTSYLSLDLPCCLVAVVRRFHTASFRVALHDVVSFDALFVAWPLATHNGFIPTPPGDKMLQSCSGLTAFTAWHFRGHSLGITRRLHNLNEFPYPESCSLYCIYTTE